MCGLWMILHTRANVSIIDIGSCGVSRIALRATCVAGPGFMADQRSRSGWGRTRDHWLHLNSVLLKDFLLAKDSVRFRAKHCKPLCGGRYKGCVDVDSCSQVLTGSESLISIVKSARDSLIWAKVGIIYPHRVHPCFYQIFRFKSDTIAKG